MRKICILITAVMLIAMLDACGAQPAEEPTAAPATEPEQQLHTIAPAETSEPEWAAVDSSLTLEDGNNIYAQDDDFVSFALIENGDGSAELRFRLDDVTAGMLKDQSSQNEYYLTVEGEKLGVATLSDDCAEVSVQGEDYYDMIAFATKIRGLE